MEATTVAKSLSGHVLAASQGGGAGAVIGGILIGLIGLGLYFLPAIVAWIRHVPNAGSVTVINVFLGWTFVGWIVALAMACRSHLPRVSITQQVNVGERPQP